MIIALIIYSSALGDSTTLKYSVLIVIGLAIALGIIPSVSTWILSFLCLSLSISLENCLLAIILVS